MQWLYRFADLCGRAVKVRVNASLGHGARNCLPGFRDEGGEVHARKDTAIASPGG